jgi:hypothetical protein
MADPVQTIASNRSRISRELDLAPREAALASIRQTVRRALAGTTQEPRDRCGIEQAPPAPRTHASADHAVSKSLEELHYHCMLNRIVAEGLRQPRLRHPADDVLKWVDPPQG